MRNLRTRIVVLFLAASLLLGPSLAPQQALAQSSDIRITITEDFVSYILTQPMVTDVLATLPTPVENPRINVKPDNKIDLTIFTELPPPFGATELTLTLGMTAANGDLTVTIETLTIRGASLPANNPLLAPQIAPIQEQIQSAVSDGLAGLGDSAGLQLSGFSTTETLIIVEMSSVE
ncbi:MAG: hypothetical protein R2873_16660 [Caldilineaceae bacterium]